MVTLRYYDIVSYNLLPWHNGTDGPSSEERSLVKCVWCRRINFHSSLFSLTLKCVWRWRVYSHFSLAQLSRWQPRLSKPACQTSSVTMPMLSQFGLGTWRFENAAGMHERTICQYLLKWMSLLNFREGSQSRVRRTRRILGVIQTCLPNFLSTSI